MVQNTIFQASLEKVSQKQVTLLHIFVLLYTLLCRSESHFVFSDKNGTRFF